MGHHLHMFLDIMELKKQDQNEILEKTDCIMWSHNKGKVSVKWLQWLFF